jgi:Spy/CpxP family protein refolding chaperone
VNGSRLKPWLAMGLIFVVGMVTGAALLFSFRGEWMHPPGAQQLRHLWLTHLTHRLNLTADQQAKIQPILADAGNQIQALHRGEVDRIAQIMNSANGRIAPLLTPEQQAELQKMEQEGRRDFSGHMRSWDGPPEHHSGDGPPPGGPPGPAPTP